MDTYLDHEILVLNVHEKKHKFNMCYGYHNLNKSYI